MGLVLRVLCVTLVGGCGRLDFGATSPGDAMHDAGDAAADPHLVAWYPFDDGVPARTTADASGNHHEAECLDTFGCPAVSTGHRGLAIGMCTVNAPGLASDDSPALRLSGAFTLAAWVRWNDTAGLSSILAKPVGTTTTDSYQLDLDASGIVRFTIGDATSFARAASPAGLPLDTWTHVAGTYDGTTMLLYVAGTQVATLPGHAIAYDTQALLIGVDYNTGAYAEQSDGFIDDVRIYDVALDAPAIAALAAQ